MAARYFTGKPCKRGHVAERYTCSCKCVECRKEDKRKWRSRNPTKDIAKCRKWQISNPDKVAVNTHKRRSRKGSNGGTHTFKDLQDIFSMQRGLCAYYNCCGNDITLYDKHIDHIIPISTGGSNDRRNIQLLCAGCNLSKGARDPLLHCRSMGLLC